MSDVIGKAAPRGNSYIWGGMTEATARLWVTCPHGCCAHGAHEELPHMPEWWRYATEEEVAAGSADVLAGARFRQGL